MPFVYLLRCSDDSLYCGWTVDVVKRIKTHEAGRGSKYVASRLPVELVASFEVKTNTDARKLEAKIKRMPRNEKTKLLP